MSFLFIGKDGRGKKSRKQKLREINQKGDTKEGSEMDAFTDKVRLTHIFLQFGQYAIISSFYVQMITLSSTPPPPPPLLHTHKAMGKE